VVVRLIGPLLVSGPQGMVDVDGRKARTLLAVLAVHGHRLVAADSVIEVLWGEQPPSQPGAGLATLVSRLRRTLGPDTVIGGRNGYRLGGSAWVDLHEAVTLIEEAEILLARGEPSQCLACAERGLELLGGGQILADHGAQAWIEPARSRQASMLRRGRHVAAEAALRTADPDRARTPALAAITDDPLDEAAYRMLMRAYAEAAQPADALRVYQRLRTVLATELGIDPAGATDDLHRTIQRRHHPAAHAWRRPPDGMRASATKLQCPSG
jgi:DNA-binding SARP family transcriptional activator